MDVVVTCEFRFFQSPDGAIWTPSAFTAQFWERYLVVFERVKVVARVKAVETVESSWQRSDASRVSFVAMPYYVGLGGLVRNSSTLIKTLNEAVHPGDALIFRVPSQMATLAALLGNASVKRYGLEVVGDPADVFASGIVNGPADKLLGWLSAWTLRRMCRHAIAASYVTQHYLQQRYPTSPSAFSIACSSIELDPTWLRTEPREYRQPAKKLLFIGSFGQLYKGQDTLLEAVAQLKQQGHELHLTLLGGGKYLDDMKALAETLAIGHLTQFVGEVNADDVKTALDEADLFVMPSRTEGLPRALIEAMATGLPAIGSAVGGIPELLEPQCLFDANNVQQLTARIAMLSQAPALLTAMSKRNRLVAEAYQKPLLEARRIAFYFELRQQFGATA
ncbi:glycosyltransferase [Alteromonas oceanisediminis]|uniref:glycosyltransferase n=1 Tax=Alteromonas oceanisediminis TaxID=2836180 RepID=UPI001BDAC4AA|nr:glycosyltransferase [Alteromonas oceanisediminis]MBT0587780.1 glycosyltransferase family 4 protein [Alteromonas oceanisediminis]